MGNVIEQVRRQIGEVVLERVVGTQGPPDRASVHGEDDLRWFPDGSPITRVHGDSAMFVAGLRALLLQSLHPLAMAGVAEHSDYRGDPWGRLARTSYFLAATTFGAGKVAEAAIARVRAVHERVQGSAADGRAYSAGDPRLLCWVHVAEVDSFLRAHQRYGARPLDPDECDLYVAQTAKVGEALGATGVPRSQADLDEVLRDFRPELAGTPAAREAARFLLLQPPLPLTARVPYTLLGAAAVSLLPVWARWPLRLPWLPLTEATLVRGAGEALTRTIRWALAAPPSDR
ncbi:oxygenase MpaB family protein [soil metagenome]